ncbi:hypothetical protein ACEPAF_4860 [Sanghuangporus sanghuang]|uniref:Ribosomal protein S21 n=1 Tax=Sanghuangporus baumii TaxID=108892 RepID=A0A9Q5HQT1_SANBA|nr:hypothetical protein A7U60_g8978 [Sanghuangporus baumii]
MAAIRFNSTSEGRTWATSIQIDAHAPKSNPIMENIDALWKRHSEIFESERLLTARDAYSGRTVEIQGGDIALGAKMLDKMLAQNGVPRDWFQNRRHKQKGDERRRLKSLRHRRRFKHEVGKMVQLVQQIRRRGS